MQIYYGILYNNEMLDFFQFLFSLPSIPPLKDVNSLFSLPSRSCLNGCQVSLPSHLSLMGGGWWRNVRFVQSLKWRRKGKKAGCSRPFDTKIVLEVPYAETVGQLGPPQKWPSQKVREVGPKTCEWDSLSCAFVLPVAPSPLWQLSCCMVLQM